MDIKVLGTGCANCTNTFRQLEQIANEKGREVNLSKVENIKDIMAYRVMSLPAIVIDGKVVHAGSVPSREKMESWF